MVMDLSVIVVTYNSAAWIKPCLESVAAQTGVGFETIVVDNASGDDTLAVVKRFDVRLLANRENVGYGRANNQGFETSRGRFIYLLNPDSQLPDSKSLVRLRDAMEAHERWGLAGTRIRSADGADETVPALSYPGQRRSHRDFSRLPGRIAWVLGASLIIRREVYAALGGFDPGFFLYSEETDLCLRARELGHEIGHIEDVTVRHIGGASEEGRDPYEICRRKLTGLHRFWRKHYSTKDAARLARRDQYRACFRMLWYATHAQLQSPHSRSWRKYRENRAIWEVSRAFGQAL
jgi:N-acetylglucosaminyl-diphospho-decaprenol L-rhamnosyltransferase